jgi:hypothetical protein
MMNGGIFAAHPFNPIFDQAGQGRESSKIFVGRKLSVAARSRKLNINLDVWTFTIDIRPLRRRRASGFGRKHFHQVCAVIPTWTLSIDYRAAPIHAAYALTGLWRLRRGNCSEQ